MKLFVTVKPNAKVNEVKQTDETHFRVAVKAAPKEGKANQAVIAALSDYLAVPKSRLSIVSGKTSKQKIVCLF